MNFKNKAGFAIFHIGFVTKYLSDVIVSGFTTGAAFHIILSQVYPFLGIYTGKVTTSFKLIGVRKLNILSYHFKNNQQLFTLIKNIIEICKNLKKVNLATVLVGFIALFVFILVKELINERYKHRMVFFQS